MAAPTLLTRCSKSELLPCLTANLPSGAEVFPRFRLGCELGQSRKPTRHSCSFQSTSSAVPQQQASKHAHTSQKQSLGFPSPPVNPTALQRRKRAHLPCIRPEDWGAQWVAQTTDCPRRISTHVISLFLWVLFQGHKSWLIGFFVCLFFFFSSSSYSVMCVFFLQPWLYRKPSASFQLVFRVDYSTCQCIFDVFEVEGELCIVLLCHFDWWLWASLVTSFSQ